MVLFKKFEGPSFFYHHSLNFVPTDFYQCSFRYLITFFRYLKLKSSNKFTTNKKLYSRSQNSLCIVYRPIKNENKFLCFFICFGFDKTDFCQKTSDLWVIREKQLKTCFLTFTITNNSKSIVFTTKLHTTVFA